MKKLLLTFSLFVFQYSFTQQNTSSFPEDFLGKYSGELHIKTEKGNQNITMEFHLTATDSIGKFNYVLVYNNSPRNYLLIEKNKEKGLYEIDENNGIILPASYNDNVLYSFFEVQGNFLSTRIAFQSKSTILFEILFSRLKNKTTTGGNSENIPQVFGYPITVFQKAKLTLIKNK